MARNKLPKPTEAELAILQVLWERGPSPCTAQDLPRIMHGAVVPRGAAAKSVSGFEEFSAFHAATSFSW